MFSAMKDTRSRPAQSSLTALLAEHFPLDPRRLTVPGALILAVIQARSVVLDQLVQSVDLPGSNDTLYQRLKRFVHFALPDFLVARFVLAHLLLVLDRRKHASGAEIQRLFSRKHSPSQSGFHAPGRGRTGLCRVLWESLSSSVLGTAIPPKASSDVAWMPFAPC
ncbi:transposase, IS4 (plasmid) [Deinococcus geothermalis DSM 11300]|uniref:Transposase, IS4 n=1 Tax=Deinococcus geothermalis (strain DSM 11300 / CIP 105573 / AG-3a) TaxID=319795 RepID=Q1J2Y0_DEIGD|nr:transposase, IS4 [Deinococcus geothermalis DSM 11300]